MQRIFETDEIGRPTATYLSSPVNGKPGDRIDVVPASQSPPLGQRLLSVFLPAGYPHTVSTDYTAYQIFDSLQAFSSSIASLLASRAVLQGIGVGDENATATAAMLLSVLQESMGRLATISFAHWASRRIEAECKMYRLAADVFNDLAFILDCLSPSLPKVVRIPFLCVSSMSRAICGVAGGSSKAILSSHFARADNIGELNAKDSSQETVISLLGMWAGGALVSHITSTIATWLWLLSLLSIHLASNHAAVRAVSMKTLNRQRANIVLSALIGEKKTLSPAEVATHERIFERDGVLRWRGSEILGTCQIGVSLRLFLRAFSGEPHKASGSISGGRVTMQNLLDLFKGEEYLLWFDSSSGAAVIVLAENVTSETQLK